MTEADITHPMKSAGQLCSYNIINGNAETLPYFAEVNSQQEIETHRDMLKVKHEITISTDYRIEFIMRQPPNGCLRG